jgi:GTPase-activating protein BEM2
LYFLRLIVLLQFHVIFDDADPEAEVHSDDDLDSPILEEVEEEEDEDSLGVPRTQEDDQVPSESYNGQYYTPM